MRQFVHYITQKVRFSFYSVSGALNTTCQLNSSNVIWISDTYSANCIVQASELQKRKRLKNRLTNFLFENYFFSEIENYYVRLQLLYMFFHCPQPRRLGRFRG